MKSILRQKSRDEKNKETQSRAELRRIVRNCAELRGIARSIQGSQLCASKIHLRWKPYSKVRKSCYEVSL